MKKYVPFILISIVQLFVSITSAQERQRAELHVETGHTLGIESISFSHDGKIVASGGWDNQIRLWNISNGQELISLSGHTNTVTSVTFSPDDTRIASCSGSRNMALKSWIKRNVQTQDKLIENDEATIKLWDVRTGRMLNSFSGFSSGISSVAFSPDGKSLASGDWEGRIKLWDVQTGKEIRTLLGHSELVQSVVFSANGNLLASASSDNVIKIWDMTTRTEVIALPGQDGVVNAISFSPDGKRLASAGKDRIVIWDLAARRIIKELKGFSGWITSVEYSSTGNQLASGSSSGQIVLWDLEHEKKLKDVKRDSAITSISFSPDGRTLASSCEGNSILLWNVASSQESSALFGHTATVNAVAFSTDGKLLASGSSDNKIKLWDIAKRREVKTLDGEGGAITAVAFSPVGKILASGGHKKLELWDVLTSRKIRRFAAQGDLIEAVAFSPNGTLLATGNVDHTIILWDALTGNKLRTLIGHEKSVLSVVFSPDGKVLASGSRDGTIRLWDVTTGRESATLTGHYSAVHSVAFSPDGSMLASGSYDGRLKLWSLPGGKIAKTLRGSGNVSSVAFSPKGNLIASGSWDNTITLWNVSSGEEQETLIGNSGGVTSITFSPDGSMLASSEMEDTVRIWNLESRSTSRVFAGHSSPVTSIALSPDKTVLASGIEDTQDTIKLWDLADSRRFKTLPGYDSRVESFAFSPNGTTLASKHWGDETIKLWNISTGEEIKYSELPSWVLFAEGKTASYGGNIHTEPSGNQFETFDQDQGRQSSGKGITTEIYGKRIQITADGSQINLIDLLSNKTLISLIAIHENDWIVATPDGRFDTNKALDSIKGLHWVVNNEILNPLSLDVFMRQYYEPDLLSRLLKCIGANSSDRVCNPVPSIADINYIQPIVSIKQIKTAGNSDNLVDVTVEVQSIADVGIGAVDKTMKSRNSGVFDLRLFRDGQLVAVSTPTAAVQRYNETSVGVSYEEEAKNWREANDLKKLKDVRFDSSGKASFTFRNVRLPHNGERQVEFSAYTFNVDRVKSNTDRKTLNLPRSVSSVQRKGRAYLLTIGVNASDNSGYSLHYAANDARKMQEVVGARLKADIGRRYAEVIEIPLISDSEVGKRSNDAIKVMIKGVFSLLAGHRDEVAKEVLGRIERVARVPAVEPEDTLIMAFAGHGYADQSGILYMLPADMPRDILGLTADALKHTISSDELSLWMRDITAKEMLLIIDACQSAAAVEGKDFKPGPMGSRGLGQLAYDKGMRVLVSTQADADSFEVRNLQQSLLSKVLIQEGVEDEQADTEREFKQLTAAEWFEFAVKAVPLDLQRPILFDFHRKQTNEGLFSLPPKAGLNGIVEASRAEAKPIAANQYRSPSIPDVQQDVKFKGDELLRSYYALIVENPTDEAAWLNLQRAGPEKGYVVWCFRIRPAAKVDNAGQLTINREVFDGPSHTEVAATWMIFGFAKVNWVRTEYFKRHPNAREYKPSFEEEFFAFEHLVKFWEEVKQDNPELSNNKFDILTRIYQDDLLDAYVYLQDYQKEFKDSYQEWKQKHQEKLIKYFNKYVLIPKSEVPDYVTTDMALPKN